MRLSSRRLAGGAIAGCAAVVAVGAGAVLASGATQAHVVKIGLEAPLTGDNGLLGQGMLHGAQLAAQRINANGGIIGPNGKPGYRIQIVPINDTASSGPNVGQADKATGIAHANAAIAQGIKFVVGPYNSGVGVGTLPIYLQHGIFPVRLTSRNATSGLGATLQPMTYQIAPVTTKALTTWLHSKSVAVIYDATDPAGYPIAEKNAVIAGLTAKHVATTQFTINTQTGNKTTYGAAVAAAEATHPSSIFVVTYTPEAAIIAKAITSSRTSSKCLLDFSAYGIDYIAKAGLHAAAKCPVVGVPSPEVFAGAAPYVSAYRAAFHAAPGVWSPYTYDSVGLLAYMVNHYGKHAYYVAYLNKALPTVTRFSGWTNKVKIAPKTLDRSPATLVVNSPASRTSFVVNPAWAKAVGYGG